MKYLLLMLVFIPSLKQPQKVELTKDTDFSIRVDKFWEVEHNGHKFKVCDNPNCPEHCRQIIKEVETERSKKAGRNCKMVPYGDNGLFIWVCNPKD